MTNSPPEPANALAAVRWYLVNTQTRREHLAFEHLERQGYRPFLPQMRKTVRHARQIRKVSTAYFPGYLFVALDIARDRWRPIDGTIGVLQILKAGGRPVPAPRGIVEALIAATDESGTVAMTSDLSQGERVRIAQGPFADQLAVVDCLRGGDRVLVLLDMMRQSTRVELGRGEVRPM